MDSGSFKEQLAELADGRRNNLTHVERVSTTFSAEHILGSMANAMAIAMVVLQSEAIPCLVAYSWRPSFNKMRAKGGLEDQIRFTEDRIATLAKPLEFGKRERTIDTRSNLRFEVLDGLARTLGLDRTPLRSQKNKLDALVNKRNSIAHGDRAAKVSEVEVSEALTCAQTLLDVVERSLHEAVDRHAYRRTPESRGVG